MKVIVLQASAVWTHNSPNTAERQQRTLDEVR